MNNKDGFLEKYVEQFDISGKIEKVTPQGNGHINDTFLVIADDGGKNANTYFKR